MAHKAVRSMRHASAPEAPAARATGAVDLQADWRAPGRPSRPWIAAIAPDGASCGCLSPYDAACMDLKIFHVGGRGEIGRQVRDGSDRPRCNSRRPKHPNGRRGFSKSVRTRLTGSELPPRKRLPGEAPPEWAFRNLWKRRPGRMAPGLATRHEARRLSRRRADRSLPASSAPASRRRAARACTSAKAPSRACAISTRSSTSPPSALRRTRFPSF